MPETGRKLKVFLCHATQDKPLVRELYRRLSAEGWIDPWLDEEKLLPGMDWEYEIEKELDASHAICVCISNASVSKEGYVQRELRFVIDMALDKPEGTLYILPVRLEDCQPPRKLRAYHYADYFPPERRDWAYGRLLKSLERRAAGLGIATSPPAAVPVAQPVVSVEAEKPKPPAPSPDRLTVAGMEFCRIRAGKFLMGSQAGDKDAYDSEKPQHTVDIPYDYWLARFPVTNAQFEQFTRASGYQTTAEQQGSAYGYTGSNWENIKGANWRHPRGPKSGIAEKGDHPVVSVSWPDAMEYCHWLNQHLQKLRQSEPSSFIFHPSSFHSSDFILRLPTEAEWEKAARGASGNIYPWGDAFDPQRLHFRENSKIDTAAVSAYPNGASPYGCEQMAGNVWEWTHSLLKKYPYQPQDGREAEKGSTGRVLRGGSFDSRRRLARAAYRNTVGGLYHDFGFRVGLAPDLS